MRERCGGPLTSGASCSAALGQLAVNTSSNRRNIATPAAEVTAGSRDRLVINRSEREMEEEEEGQRERGHKRDQEPKEN